MQTWTGRLIQCRKEGFATKSPSYLAIPAVTQTRPGVVGRVERDVVADGAAVASTEIPHLFLLVIGV